MLNDNQVFILLLVALSIVGAICLSLCTVFITVILSKKRENTLQQNSKLSVAKIGQNDLSTKIDKYHKDIIKGRHENLMYIFWGLALSTLGIGLALRNTTDWILPGIFALVFLIFGFIELVRYNRTN